MKSGVVVLVLEPRPTPPGTESIKSPYLGPFNLLSLRAMLVGRTIVALRVDDVIRAVDWMVSRPAPGTDHRPRGADGVPLGAAVFGSYIAQVRAAERAAGLGSGQRIVTTFEPAE